MQPIANSLSLLIGLALAGQAPPGRQEDGLGALVIEQPSDRTDVKPVPPPAGAVVLFDGSDLDKWVAVDGTSPAPWKLVEGGAMQVSGPKSIKTRDTFGGRFLLHVEFRVPDMPEAKGQARGNSGVYVQGRYEVQILDSFGLPSQDNDCGAIYEVAAPRVNACKAPTIWQSYEIDFQAPTFRDGRKVRPAVMTVVQNGTPIHRKRVIPVDNTRAGLGGDPSQPGPIMLQSHGSTGDPVEYRNIWLQPLD